MAKKIIEVEEGDNKFIHYKYGEDEGVISKNLPWHKNIYASIEEAISESSVVGGGTIKLNKQEKTIYIVGSSGSYGSTNHEHIKELLQEEFGPEYTIITQTQIDKERREERERKKSQTLEAIASDENLLGVLSSMPTEKKVNLYNQTGINQLNSEEVKSYVLKQINDTWTGKEPLDELIRDFSLSGDSELKEAFLSPRSLRFVDRELEFRGGYDAYTHFSDKAITLDTLLSYLKELGELFPISKEDTKTLAQSIVDKNVENKKRSHRKFGIPLLHESYKIAEEFDLNQELVYDILNEKIERRVLNEHWINSNQERENILNELRELPAEKQDSTLASIGEAYVDRNLNLNEKDYDYVEVHGLSVFSYNFLKHFGNTLDESQKQLLEKGMEKGAIRFITGDHEGYSYGNKLDKKYLKELKQIIDYNKKIGKGIKKSLADELIKGLIENAFSFYHERLGYPNGRNIRDSGIFSLEELVGYAKEVFIKKSDYSGDSRHPKILQGVLNEFGVSEEKQQDIIREELKRIVENPEISEAQAFNYVEYSKFLHQGAEGGLELEYDINPVCEALIQNGRAEKAYGLTDLVKGFDGLKSNIVKGIISDKSKYDIDNYIKEISNFFKNSKEDASQYKDNLNQGLTRTFSYSKADESRQEYAEHLMNLELGLQEDADKSVRAVINYQFDHIGEQDIRTHNIRKTMDKYNVSQNDYKDKIDGIISRAVSEGDLKTATYYAEVFNHKYKDELKTLNKIVH